MVVTNTPGVLTEATADLAFGLLLAAARRIAEGDRLVRAGDFPGWAPTFLLGARVHGTTLGLVGMGRIGQAMARRARGFGMHVVYASPVALPAPLERALGATRLELDELFEQADFVSLHCPLTRETRHLVDAAPPGADAPRRGAREHGARRLRRRGRRWPPRWNAVPSPPPASTSSRTSRACTPPCSRPATSSSRRTSAAPTGRRGRPWPAIAADNVLAVLDGKAPLTPA